MIKKLILTEKINKKLVAKNLKINKQLFDNDTLELPDNIAAAVVLIDDKNKIAHSGIVIRYNGESKLLHFNPPEVLLESLTDYPLYYYKELTFIDPELIPTFLAHCEIIQNSAKPKYFYFYANSIYDANGDFITDKNMPEYMSCVGFCLNVLEFFLADESFFDYSDWDSSTLNKEDSYIDHFIDKVLLTLPETDTEELRKNIKRIFPIEYLSGAFLERPVKKEKVDLLAPKLTAIIKNRMSLVK